MKSSIHSPLILYMLLAASDNTLGVDELNTICLFLSNRDKAMIWSSINTECHRIYSSIINTPFIEEVEQMRSLRNESMLVQIEVEFEEEILRVMVPCVQRVFPRISSKEYRAIKNTIISTKYRIGSYGNSSE